MEKDEIIRCINDIKSDINVLRQLLHNIKNGENCDNIPYNNDLIIAAADNLEIEDIIDDYSTMIFNILLYLYSSYDKEFIKSKIKYYQKLLIRHFPIGQKYLHDIISDETYPEELKKENYFIDFINARNRFYFLRALEMYQARRERYCDNFCDLYDEFFNNVPRLNVYEFIEMDIDELINQFEKCCQNKIFDNKYDDPIRALEDILGKYLTLCTYLECAKKRTSAIVEMPEFDKKFPYINSYALQNYMLESIKTIARMKYDNVDDSTKLISNFYKLRNMIRYESLCAIHLQNDEIFASFMGKLLVDEFYEYIIELYRDNTSYRNLEIAPWTFGEFVSEPVEKLLEIMTNEYSDKLCKYKYINPGPSVINFDKIEKEIDDLYRKACELEDYIKQKKNSKLPDTTSFDSIYFDEYSFRWYYASYISRIIMLKYDNLPVEIDNKLKEECLSFLNKMRIETQWNSLMSTKLSESPFYLHRKEYTDFIDICWKSAVILYEEKSKNADSHRIAENIMDYDYRDKSYLLGCIWTLFSK